MYLQVKGFVIIIGGREAVYLKPLVPAAASEQLEVSAPTQENIPRRVQHLQVRPRILKGQSQEKNMSTF